MFPNSKIAESYQQQETKLKYLLQFGIVPYIRKKLLMEVKDQAFFFFFDESTTKQVKKQCDDYFIYYLLSQKEILTS